MAAKPDYYSILGVEPGSTPAQISRAYRALMRSHHPDVGSAPGDTSELLRIMEAFAVLRDPARRKNYDAESAGRWRKGSNEDPATADNKAGGGGHAARRQADGHEGRDIPVRYSTPAVGGNQDAPATIRVSPVRWESGPWS